MSIAPYFTGSQSELTKSRQTRILGLPVVTDEPDAENDDTQELSVLNIRPSSKKSNIEKSKESKDSIIQTYLNKTELLKVIEELITNVLSGSQLPYNPYPGLVKSIRGRAERFHMFAESDDEILEKLNRTVLPAEGSLVQRSSQNVSLDDTLNVWGLSSLLSVVDTDALHEYSWLMTNLTENKTSPDLIHEGYECEKMAAVIGSGVFVGSLLPFNLVLHFRVEYLITGPQRQQAVEMFSQIILRDILDTEQQSEHIFLGVVVPTRIPSTNDWSGVFWTMDRISDQQDEFCAKVQYSTLNLQITAMECLFKLDPQTHQYKYGKKQVNLNFIQTKPQRQQCVTVQPYLTLHEGVFLFHDQACSYQAMFTEPAVENSQQISTAAARGSQGWFNRKKKRKSTQQESRTQSTSVRPVTGSVPGPGQTRQSTRQAPQTRQAETRQASVIHEAPENLSGPAVQQVVQKIREAWYEKVAGLDMVSDLFDMIPYLVLILLLDRDYHAPVYLIEIHRLAHSTAYRLYSMMSMNTHLLQLISHFQSKGVLEDDKAQSYFLLYKRTLLQLLDNEIQERSSEMCATHEIITNMLQALTPVTLDKQLSLKLPLNESSTSILTAVNHVCQSLLWQFTQVALELTPGIVSFVESIYKEFLGYVPAPDFRRLSVLADEGNENSNEQTFRHGVEIQQQIRQSKMVLMKDKALMEIQSPVAVKPEAVILQYCVESRLDSTFQDFLSELVNGPSLPPNPYPRLVSTLKDSAYRLELYDEPDDKLLTSLLHGKARIFNPSLHIYSIPGCSAYGSLCTLAVLDSNSFTTVVNKFQKFTTQVNTKATVVSKFKVTVGVSVGGFTPLYGRMSPYLHYIDLDEHFFLQSGKQQSKADVTAHFSKLVYDHVQEVIDAEGILVIGLFLGSEKVCWTPRQMADPHKKQSFINQLTETVSAMKPVVLRGYILTKWRFILVDKKLLLHAVTAKRYEGYFTPNPLALYQSVFTSSEVAVLYFTHCGVQDVGDPCAGKALNCSLRHVNQHVIETVFQANYLNVYRWMLLRTLANQHKLFVSSCWKMLHSIAGQLEYLETLNKTLQQLITEDLSRTFLPTQQDSDKQTILETDKVTTMFQAYRQKVGQVLEHGTCFIPEYLSYWIKEKLQDVTYKDLVDNKETIIMSHRTVAVFEEIHLSLVPWKLITAREIHSLFPDVQKSLSALTLEGRDYTPFRMEQS